MGKNRRQTSQLNQYISHNAKNLKHTNVGHLETSVGHILLLNSRFLSVLLLLENESLSRLVTILLARTELIKLIEQV